MREKKKGRRAYLNDFHKNVEGQYEYAGERYEYCGDEKSRRRAAAGLMGGALLLVALILGEGCIPVPGLSRTFYVLLPYMVELMGGVSACIAAGRLLTAEYPLREYVYQSTIQKLPFRGAAAAFGAGLTLAGETVYLIRNGSEGMIWYVALFYILQAAALLIAILLFCGSGKMEWKRR